MTEPRGYNCLLKIPAGSRAINILFPLCLLQELFTFSKHVTYIFNTPSLTGKVLFYKDWSSIKLIWYVVPQATASSCLTMAVPLCRKCSVFFPSGTGKKRWIETSWFTFRRWYLFEQDRQSLPWQCLAEVLLSNDTSWTTVCTGPCWQSGQLGIEYLDSEQKFTFSLLPNLSILD